MQISTADLTYFSQLILYWERKTTKKAASKPPKCKQTQFFCEMGDVQSWSCAGQPIFTSFFQFLTLWGHDFGVVREAEDDFWRPASIALVLKCHRSPTFVLQYLNLSQKIWFHKYPEYFVCLLFEYFFPDKSFKLISKCTQKCQYNSLY